MTTTSSVAGATDRRLVWGGESTGLSVARAGGGRPRRSAGPRDLGATRPAGVAHLSHAAPAGPIGAGTDPDEPMRRWFEDYFLRTRGT